MAINIETSVKWIGGLDIVPTQQCFMSQTPLLAIVVQRFILKVGPSSFIEVTWHGWMETQTARIHKKVLGL